MRIADKFIVALLVLGACTQSPKDGAYMFVLADVESNTCQDYPESQLDVFGGTHDVTFSEDWVVIGPDSYRRTDTTFTGTFAGDVEMDDGCVIFIAMDVDGILLDRESMMLEMNVSFEADEFTCWFELHCGFVVEYDAYSL